MIWGALSSLQCISVVLPSSYALCCGTKIINLYLVTDSMRIK